MRFVCPRAWWYLILVILIRIISQYGLSFQQNFLKGASYSVQPTWENVRWCELSSFMLVFNIVFFLCHTLATVVFFPFLNSSRLFPASGSLHTWFRLPWMLPHGAPPRLKFAHHPWNIRWYATFPENPHYPLPKQIPLFFSPMVTYFLPSNHMLVIIYTFMWICSCV